MVPPTAVLKWPLASSACATYMQPSIPVSERFSNHASDMPVTSYDTPLKRERKKRMPSNANKGLRTGRPVPDFPIEFEWQTGDWELLFDRQTALVKADLKRAHH